MDFIDNNSYAWYSFNNNNLLFHWREFIWKNKNNKSKK